VLTDGLARLQAGAGIVADSDPRTENEECLRKLAALEAALEEAES
jgi:anthranilate synthase component 1